MRTALIALIRKELIQTFRDKRLVFMMIVTPLIQLVVFGYAVNLEVENVKVVVADQDRSETSRRFLLDLMAGDTFRVRERVDDPKLAARWLTSGEASIAVVLPTRFARNWSGRRKASVQILVDGGQSISSVVAANAVGSYSALLTMALMQQALTERMMGLAAASAGQVPQITTSSQASDGTTQTVSAPSLAGGDSAGLNLPKTSFSSGSAQTGSNGNDAAQTSSGAASSSQPSAPPMVPRFELRPRVLYNPGLKSRIFMVPGVAASLLLILTILITAVSVARERESGTLDQIMVTPIRPLVLMLGKTLPYALIGFMDLLLVLAAGAWFFDIPMRGPLIVVFVGGLLYLMSTLGMGLFISTSSGSQQQAILVSFFIIMPAILLSGFVAPVENMPGWLRPWTLLDPMRHYVEILRFCLLKGSSWWDLAPQLVALATLGTALLTGAALRFRKQLQ